MIVIRAFVVDLVATPKSQPFNGVARMLFRQLEKKKPLAFLFCASLLLYKQGFMIFSFKVQFNFVFFQTVFKKMNSYFASLLVCVFFFLHTHAKKKKNKGIYIMLLSVPGRPLLQACEIAKSGGTPAARSEAY